MLLFLKDIQSNINSGLLLVYGLIVFIIFLIAVILIVDKIHHKKEESMFHSRHLKNRLKELQEMESEKRLETRYQERREKQEEYVSEPPQELIEEIISTDAVEVVEVEKPQEIIETFDLKIEDSSFREEVKPIETENFSAREEKKLPSKAQDELEKTQAQIEVEEITKALEKAVQEEQELNKYAKFEEEQEQNAIISYAELKGKFDELYEANEKIQYVNDDTIPINLKELYETNELMQTENQKNPPVKEEESQPVKAADLPEKKPGEFRNSPIISPVYGIQKDDFQIKKEVSRTSREDLQTTTDFLNALKELQKNLD